MNKLIRLTFISTVVNNIYSGCGDCCCCKNKSNNNNGGSGLNDKPEESKPEESKPEESKPEEPVDESKIITIGDRKIKPMSASEVAGLVTDTHKDCVICYKLTPDEFKELNSSEECDNPFFKKQLFGEDVPFINMCIDDTYLIYSCNRPIENEDGMLKDFKFDRMAVLNFLKKPLITCRGMFRNMSNLTNLYLTDLKTENVEDMGFLFSGCKGLTKFDVSRLVTDKVKNMESMFSDCVGLTGINGINFVTKNVTSMSRMFANCISLEGLNLSGFDTGNVTDMSEMFSGCENLKELDLSNFNFKNVKKIERMFFKCKKLEWVQFGDINTAKIEKWDGLFAGCESLQSVYLESENDIILAALNGIDKRYKYVWDDNYECYTRKLIS